MAKSNQSPFLKKATGTAKASVVSESPKKRHGLGRGLDSLLPTTGSVAAATPALAKTPVVAPIPMPVPASVPVAAAPQAGAPLELRILEIERSPFQPRRDFKETELMELADSLKNNGLVQPPTVRKNAAGRYELIAGERRLRAAQLAGWTKIPVTLIDADDQTAAVMTTTENLQREAPQAIRPRRGLREKPGRPWSAGSGESAASLKKV